MKSQVSSVVLLPFAVLYLFVIALFLALVIVSALFGKQVGLTTVRVRPRGMQPLSSLADSIAQLTECVRACACVRA